MIKHIVMFKMLDEAEGRTGKENAVIAKEMLDKLPSYINEIKELETGLNYKSGEKAFDLVLVTEFESKEDLEIYKTHSEHLKVLEFFDRVRELTRFVDYEILENKIYSHKRPI